MIPGIFFTMEKYIYLSYLHSYVTLIINHHYIYTITDILYTDFIDLFAIFTKKRNKIYIKYSDF